MKFTASALLLILSAVASASAEDAAADAGAKKPVGRMMVNKYDGPDDCADDEKVQAGQFLSMHYTGTIHSSSATGEQGKQFDSSRDRGETFDFQVGVGQVIQGWDKGLIGLCKGTKANLVIPPEMGYGERGAGADIPGGATLNFDIEVVDIAANAPPQPNLFTEIDTNGDGKLTREEVEAFFIEKKQSAMPDGLWEAEDKDGDGFISWEEFGGPKGDGPGGEEL